MNLKKKFYVIKLTMTTKCEVCYEIYDNKEVLYTHLLDVHNIDKKYLSATN